MSDVVTRVGFEVDQAAVGEVKTAAATVSAELNRVGRRDAFKDLGVEFAKASREVENTGEAVTAFLARLDELKASDAEIKAATQAFLEEGKAIDKAAEAAEKKEAAIAKAFEKELAAIQRVEEAAARKAARDLERAEIAAHAENDARNAAAVASSSDSGDSSSGPGALSTFGRNLRNLPSVQIPGLGISTDAIGNLARVAGAFQDTGKTVTESLKSAGLAIGFLKEATDAAKAAEAAKTAVEVAGTTTTTAAAAAETAETATKGGLVIATTGAALSAGALAVALLPIAAIGIAVAGGVALVGAALNDLNKKSQEAANALKQRYEAEDKVDELVRSGATVEDAYARRAELEREVADATQRSNEAQAEKEATFAADAKASGDAAARLRGNNAVYKEFDERIASTKQSASDASAELAELNKQIDGGAFAAATAKEKAEQAAKDKEKADEEAARAQEQAQRQAEAAAAKEQQAREQAAAKEQQAQEKAAREAEAQAEKVRQAQDQIAKSNDNYANKLTDLATTASQRVSDIEQEARDKSEDDLLKYNDDLATIALKARRDEAEEQRKDADDEIAATIKQGEALEDIRDEVDRNARKSLEDRNFLAATQAEESGQESLDKVATAAKREAAERDRANQTEARERLLKLDEARQDRLAAYEIEIRDADRAAQRKLRNEETNEQRQEAQALVAFQREQKQYTDHLNALVGIRSAGYAAELAAAQGQAPDTSGIRGAGQSTTTTQTTIYDHRSFTGFSGSVGGLLTVEALSQIRREQLRTMQQLGYGQ